MGVVIFCYPVSGVGSEKIIACDRGTGKRILREETLKN
jgi:hypothetical protein